MSQKWWPNSTVCYGVIFILCADGKLKTWVYGVAAGAFVLLIFIISMTYLAW